MMVVGSTYHALFYYTGVIAKEAQRDKSPGLIRLLSCHRAYLLYIYRWAALPGIVGSLAFVSTCLSRETKYPPWVCLFVPAWSAPMKLLLRSQMKGGLILCGGLTNIW